MSTITPMMPAVAAADPQWVPSSLYRMTVEEYEAMVAAGTFRGRNASISSTACWWRR